jgi:hypothetical protein
MGQDFWKASCVGRVCVQNTAPNSFLEALVYKTKAAEKSKTAYHNASFPKLRYIHLDSEDIDFSATGSMDTSVDMLLNCLTERCERNAAVQVLRLDDCYDISYDEIEKLREVVVVIWDELENENEDSDCSDG